MPRLLLVEHDAARRDALQFILAEARIDVIASTDHAEVLQRLSAQDIDVLLLGDDNLRLLDDLPRQDDGSLTVAVLTLIDPVNAAGILASLSTGVRGIISRDRPASEIIAKIKSLLRPVDPNVTNPHQVTISGDGSLQDRTYRQQDLVEALEAACDDIARLQQRYEDELAQRRKVELALMESEAFYQSLVETLPLAMLRKDLQGRFTFANRLLCEALRRTPDEIVGRTDYDFFPRELAEKYRSDDRRVVESERDLEVTEEFQTPTGERRYTHVVKTPVYDAKGNPVGIQGIFSDVTEKKRAEIELNQTRARLQAVLDAATQVSIIATDVNGVIDVFNVGAERMLGYTAEEMVGRRTPEIIHSASEILARAQSLSQEHGGNISGLQVFTENARRGQPDEGDWTYIRKDGSQLFVNLVITARRDRDDRVIGYLGIATDITARKRAEADMLKAKEAAEAANRAKSDFLANMSHEIRTPMNAIIGMTELVLDTPLSLPQREYLSMVHESGESLLAVINDILDFSKIEAGKLSLERVPFNVREVLGDALKTLSLRAHRKRLELVCHVAPDVPFAVEGDPHRLRQTVINLVGNAIKFTEAGEVVLDVAVERFEDGGPMLQFSVLDTGVGIPQEKMDTIFEAFEQADTSTTRRYGGTGLGLAIVSRLVDLMDGNIWVESEVGQGSNFHFTARFGSASAEALPNVADIYPPLLRGLRVLVVDDNATSRRILSEMLTNWGMQPIAVPTVSEGIAELERSSEQGSPYALILTDSNMPGQDGFELAQQIQNRKGLCGAMIMMLTSADRSNDLSRCQELNISAYLVKPVKQSELLDSIVQAVGVNTAFAGSAVSSSTPGRTASVAKSILLAEDSLINQKLAIGLLERWGHRVTVASNGNEAVRLSDNEEFDLILMDVQMPELDGLDATREIRQREEISGRHLPIIAMTAHAMKGDRELCLAAGMDGYLMKPIRAEQLFRQIEDATDDRRSAEPGQKKQVDQVNGLVNWTVANRAVNGDSELLKQVVAAFLSEGPQLLSTLENAYAENDGKRFQRAAHTLKSALRTFGVDNCNAAEELELAAKNGLNTIEPTRIAAVVAQVQPVFLEMEHHLRTNSANGTIR
ncbi:MAG: hybrid sensor histidine kinase/response regulator [Schlesneria sp.]|nr:hybrid sensor histidine kinase/response regulator [Schlesneria sp.]